MGNAKRNPGDEDPNAEASGAAREPDLSVPDFEIEAERAPRPERPPSADAPPRPRFGKGQWLILWLVITLGVAAGHLLANLVTSLAVAHTVRAVVGEVVGDAGEASGEVREQRKASERGQSLARQCEDWRAAHEELNTETTKKNRDKYCGAYRQYLDTGRVVIE